MENTRPLATCHLQLAIWEPPELGASFNVSRMGGSEVVSSFGHGRFIPLRIIEANITARGVHHYLRGRSMELRCSALHTRNTMKGFQYEVKGVVSLQGPLAAMCRYFIVISI